MPTASGRLAPRDVLIRATRCILEAKARGHSDAYRVHRDHFKDDSATFDLLGRILGASSPHIVQKAASAPAATSGSWGGSLSVGATADFVLTLGTASAASTLLQNAIRIPLADAAATAIVPVATPSAGLASFVAEGSPIPIESAGVATSLTIGGLRKVASLFGFTSEMSKSTAIEDVIRALMVQSAAMAIDSVLFDAAAASAIRPAGLRNGVSSLTPTAGGGETAAIADLGQMIAALVTAGYGRNFALYLHPQKAGTFVMRFPNTAGLRIIPTAALPVTTAMLIEDNALLLSIGDTPDIEASNSAVLHYEDASPLQIGTTGTPTTVAAPSQSLYQTSTIALRFILELTWVKRPGSAVLIDSITW